jgi:hypothetical protein
MLFQVWINLPIEGKLQSSASLVPETAISNTISSSSTHVTEVRASSPAAASSSDRKSLLFHVES